MLDHKKVRALINDYYISFGEVYSKENRKPVEDENTILEVKAAFYIVEQAQVSFKKQEPGKIDEDNDEFTRQATETQADAWFINQNSPRAGLRYTLDYYIDKLIFIYGLNGDRNKYPQNETIWKIVESNGHCTGIAEDESYYLLKGKARDYGESILRYVARRNNFDLEDIEINITPSTIKEEPNKITIDFKKGQVLKTRVKKEPKKQKENITTGFQSVDDKTDDKTIVSMESANVTKKHVEYSRKMLEGAQTEDDIEQIMYWGLRVKLSEIQLDINMANEQIALAKASYDDITITRWEEIKSDLNDKMSAVHNKFDSFKRNMKMAKDNLAMAPDQATIEYWENILATIKNEITEYVTNTGKKL